MKIAGRHFWPWMGVWILSLSVKGDLFSVPKEKPAGQVTKGTTNTKHKVPLLKVPPMTTQKGREKSTETPMATQSKTTHNISSDAFTVKQKGQAADGSSKDPGYITARVRRHKKHK